MAPPVAALTLYDGTLFWSNAVRHDPYSFIEHVNNRRAEFLN
jgi:hypothetical protein